ncbi:MULTISPECIES: glycosyltransferase family 2 protein [unclassified Salegentibacter]|jgi:GT2 family glycosyltransferase|uniref:glycosyltransferase family 2 protein n=1 Tax=unclassified Salegentibacter TaxID=2633436 RepID=UPI00094A1E2D|nr:MULTISPECIES: glycosyltransferase family 2 protein [unclassified Salegentibacter]APS38897.1 glycosyl transferase family 2 [Salegentibacter sp. T436]
MSTAVVILNWNGRSLLEQFLPSVIRFSEGANIYVADNASTDDSVEFVQENFPQVKIIQNKENGGFAKGYNDALSGLSEDIFVLLNSDVEVTKNWLNPILEIFKNEPKTAAVQPKILDFKRKNYFEYAGAAGGYIDKYGYPFCRGRIFDTLEEDHGQYNDDTPIFWASGACFAIRNTVYWEAGALDEDFFAHQEEIDLCWRIHNLGYQIKFSGISNVYHVGGATLDSMNPRKTFFNFRNSLYMLLKNVPTPNVYGILIMRMILDGIAGIKFLINGKFSHLYAILQAHTAFYRNFQKMHRKRRGITKNSEYYQVKSIIWSYFCLGKNEFSKLK